MIKRLLRLPQQESILLFGARGTGKSTLIQHCFPAETSLRLDLLDPKTEQKFARDPAELSALVRALPAAITHVLVDEIQKIPKLLDVIHSLIESTNKKFVLTGSSARKLRAGGANLLAGRALVYHLYPLSILELLTVSDTALDTLLQWGGLPKIFNTAEEDIKQKFLQSYAQTYLKEEIWAEQIIKNLDPFRAFLEVSAQMNGKIINFTNIARDIGVDPKTVQNYYSILEDTLIGFFLPGFHHSFRKSLSTKPKFYFFDLGVTRALSRQLGMQPTPGTSYYGELFEQFIILECHKLASYFKSDYKLSYFSTKDGNEIDLVVERPGEKILFIEIKSSSSVQPQALSNFIKLTQDFGDCEAICLSQDAHPKKYQHVTVLPWQEGLKQYFSD